MSIATARTKSVSTSLKELLGQEANPLTISINSGGEEVDMLELADVSVNNKLTKQRVSELMNSASQKQKDDIDATAKISGTSMNRVCATGNVNIMVTNIIARQFDVNPLYITGDADELGEFTDDNLKAIHEIKGYLPPLDLELHSWETSIEWFAPS